MDLILPRLYLGSLDDGHHAYAPLTRVINLHEDAYDSAILTLHRPIPDEMWLPPHVWHELVRTVHVLMRQGQTVLVHCRLGVSRAPTLIAAYLMQTQGVTAEGALALLQSKRSVVKPHTQTWRGMCEWHAGFCVSQDQMFEQGPFYL